MLVLLCVMLLMCACSTSSGSSHYTFDMFIPDQHLPTDHHVYSTATLTSGDSYYCNHHHRVNGDEGKRFAGYALKQVHVILSPGQTNILSKVKGHDRNSQQISCDLNFHSNSSDKINNFQETASIYKTVQHERHSFKEFHPTFSRTCSNNHLTTVGFGQLVSIGEHIHNSYFNEPFHKQFMPKSSHVRVESIADHSTYQSSLSFLHGLLPEKDFTKSKIFKTLHNFCDAIESDLPSCYCSKTAELSPFVSQALVRGRFMFKDVLPYKSELLELFESDLVSDYSSLELLELSSLLQCNNLTSLCDDGGRCCNFSRQKQKNLVGMTSHFLQQLHLDPTFRYFSELNTYPFLERLVHRSEDLDWSENLNVYTGDKQFLQTLMTNLGVKRTEVVPLASRLVFEILQKNPYQIDGGKVYMRVLYNGLDVTEGVTGCNRNMENGLCAIAGFQQHVGTLRTQYLSGCVV